MKPCMTEIYLHARCAHYRSYMLKQLEWQGAIVILWSEVSEFIRTGNETFLGRRVPHLWFSHMITVSEVLYTMCQGLQVHRCARQRT